MAIVPLEYRCVRIAGLDIGPESRFRFRWSLPQENSTDLSDVRLIESVGRFGVLQPPLLANAGQGIEIISGFRRLAACLEAGLDESPALIISGGPEATGQLMSVWFEAAFYGRSLSEMEKITLAAKASAMAGDRLSSFLPGLSSIFERSVTADFISRICGLTELETAVLEAIHDGRISPGDLLQLGSHPGIDLEAAAGLLAGSGLSRSGRRKAVRAMLRLADRGKDAFACFIRDRSSSDGPFEDAIETLVYPQLRKDLAEAAGAIEEMGLPPGVSIHLPENMEGGSCGIEIDLRSKEGLELSLKKLGEGIGSGAVGRLLKIVRAGEE